MQIRLEIKKYIYYNKYVKNTFNIFYKINEVKVILK